MSTFNHHIYAVKEILEQGLASDDAPITNSFIAHLLNQARSILIKRKLDKGQYNSAQNYQSFCVDLISSTYHDCECLDGIGCTVLRTKLKIPKYLTTATKEYIQVRYLNGKLIDPTSPTRNSLISGSESAQDTPVWYLNNNYIFVENTTTLPTIVIRGIFDDPDSIIDYCNTNSTIDCFTEDSEYPIDGDLVIPMYKLVWEMVFPSKRFPKDSLNNSAPVQTTRHTEI